MNDNEYKRCFIGIFLPKEAINEIKRIQETVKKKNFFIGKFIELENLHLTLKFLGEIDNNKINEVRGRLRKINFRGFEASFDEIGVFSKKFIKILWIKLAGVDELQKQIDSVLENLFNKEERFMSHLTIARVKNVYDKKGFLEYLENLKYKKLGFKINSFYLMESELKPEGPIYREIEKYRLES